MAIESTLQLEFPGLSIPVPVEGGFTRIVEFRGTTQQIGLIQGDTPNPVVKLECLEWENKAAAQRVFEVESSPYEGDPDKYQGSGELSFELKTRYQAAIYDESNPEHLRQRQEIIDRWQAKVDAGEPVEPLEKQLEGWEPSEAVEYKVWTETLHVWRGNYVKEPIRQRTVELPLEQAIQVVQMQVPGKNPQENFDRIESQVYRAAMQSGLFLNPKIA